MRWKIQGAEQKYDEIFCTPRVYLGGQLCIERVCTKEP